MYDEKNPSFRSGMLNKHTPWSGNNSAFFFDILSYLTRPINNSSVSS